MGNTPEDRSGLLSRIQQLEPSQFERVALDVFRYQAVHKSVYGHYLELLGVQTANVKSLVQIPFLPISFFKTHELAVWCLVAAAGIFQQRHDGAHYEPAHPVNNLAFYRENAARAFAHFYGPVEQYAVLALLPSYLERSGSSLVFMVDDFIRRSAYPQSGFFLYETERLLEKLSESLQRGQPTLLLGVSFALLDLAEQCPTDLSGAIIMETGGMKGRRREITRTELHQQLSTAFRVPDIHSEYGMTELLSQAYSKGKGLFSPRRRCGSLPGKSLIRSLRRSLAAPVRSTLSISLTWTPSASSARMTSAAVTPTAALKSWAGSTPVMCAAATSW